MTKSEFLREQFLSLRKEISESQARQYKVILYGIIFLPAANFIGQSYKIDVIIVSLPILVIIVSLLYLSQTRAIMRCGRYILTHIEPKVAETVGWEKWLEDTNNPFKPRLVDRFVNYCLYLLYFIYYAGSLFLSYKFVKTEYGSIFAFILLAIYLAIGIMFLIFLLKNIQLSTSTKTDEV
jgi:hypothetical protein